MTSQLHKTFSAAFGAAMLLLAASTITLAQSKPTFERVVVDLGKSQIEITGSNFGASQPTVTLNGSGVSLITHTPERIVADLPTQAEGGYSLAVTNHDSAADNQASFSYQIGSPNEESPVPVAAKPAAAVPSGFTLSGWTNTSYNCPASNWCTMAIYSPLGAQVVGGGCGSYYNAYSVYMVNSSAITTVQGMGWYCFVNNQDLVNGHTIVDWVQWATPAPGAAGAVQTQTKPTTFILTGPNH